MENRSKRELKYIEILKKRRDFLLKRSKEKKLTGGSWDDLEANALTWVLIQIGEEQPNERDEL